jgi:hypothetical protein
VTRGQRGKPNNILCKEIPEMSNNKPKREYTALKVTRDDWRMVKTVSSWLDMEISDYVHQWVVDHVFPELQRLSREIQGTNLRPREDGKSHPGG